MRQGNQLIAIFLLGVVSVVSCDATDEDHAVTRETCAEMCAHLGCSADVTAEQVGACADRCVDKQAEVDALGTPCADAYVRSVTCVANLDCEGFEAWERGDEEICGGELAGFERSCPGVSFDFSGQGE